jgi:flagellar biosynthesis protein FlhG
MKPMLLTETDQNSRNLAAAEIWGGAAPLRVIAVTSGKGGVGKSNIVANLGIALARQGLKVLLIDADLGLANLDILLGLTARFTIYDVLSLRKTLAEVIVPGPEGVKVLPASSGIADLAELDKFQKLLLLNELDHYAENLDVVLIDTGAGISGNVIFFNLASQERIVVANNQPTSVTDAYAMIKILATRHGERHFKLLVNGLSRSQEAEAVHRTLLMVAARFLGVDIHLEYLGFIPHDESIPQAVMRQQPVLILYPQAPASKSFIQLAQRLRQLPPRGGMAGSLRFFWSRLWDHPGGGPG